MLDPYATLGVPRGASEPQVRQAYRRLAKRYHPDLHRTAERTERMQRVNQAWEILSNPVRRARYDADFAARGSAGVGYRSASRRTAPMSYASTTWNGTWAPRPAGARRYSAAGSRSYAAHADTSGCAVAVLIALICLFVLVALFAGVVPFPLVGLLLFAVVRGIFGLFGEGRR
jgi:curved DNA-binding protein CbpA